MDPKFRDLLKQRHDFQSWSTLGRELRITNFTFTGEELPEFHLLRVDRRETPDGPRLQSLWKRSDQELLSIDVMERASSAAASEAVIEFLGEFESPLMARLPGNPYGDVAFAMPGETAVLFARGNLVMLLRNAGPKTMALGPVAQRLDEGFAERR